MCTCLHPCGRYVAGLTHHCSSSPAAVGADHDPRVSLVLVAAWHDIFAPILPRAIAEGGRTQIDHVSVVRVASVAPDLARRR